MERNRLVLQRVEDELQRDQTAQDSSSYAADERLFAGESDPLTFDEALISPHKYKWILVMHELRSLHINQTCEPVLNNSNEHRVARG